MPYIYMNLEDKAAARFKSMNKMMLKSVNQNEMLLREDVPVRVTMFQIYL